VHQRRLCSRCSVISLSTKDGGAPVICPGCFTQDGETQDHLCTEIGSFSTSRTRCPFCEQAIVLPPAQLVTAAAAAPEVAPAVPRPVTARATEPVIPAIRIAKAPPDQSPSRSEPVVTSPPAQPVPGPRDGTRVKLMVSAVAVLLLAMFYLVLGPKSFTQKVDAALADKRYFAPPGESVYDIYTEEARRDPGSAEVRAVAAKIRSVLEPPARAEVEHFYRDSVTDLHWDEIERYFAFLVVLAPDATDLQVRLAYAEGQRKLNKDRDHRGALDAYLRALKLDPSFALALNGLAKVYVQDSSPIRDDAVAVHYYKQAAEVDPHFTWPLKNLGEYHMRRGEWDEADAYMTRALTTSPERVSILMALGRIKYNQRHYQDALAYYNRALARVRSSEDVNRINSALEQIRQKLNG
jgi:Flp pilus assembly protein TadD